MENRVKQGITVVASIWCYISLCCCLMHWLLSAFLGARGHPPGAYSARVFHLCPFASICRHRSPFAAICLPRSPFSSGKKTRKKRKKRRGKRRGKKDAEKKTRKKRREKKTRKKDTKKAAITPDHSQLPANNPWLPLITPNYPRLP